MDWVTADFIREYFNRNNYYQKALNGELITKIKRSDHPEVPPKGEPVCTHSQIVYYFDQNGRPLAVVHQYLRPDGSLGASGQPDPKRIILSDKIIATRQL